MKRAFVFLVLAPVAVFLTVLLIGLAVAGTKYFGFAWFGATALSILTLPMSATAASHRWISGTHCPISSRACLIVIVGATIASVRPCVFSSLCASSLMMALAIGASAA